MSDKGYKPDFMAMIGRVGNIDWRGRIESLKTLGINFDSPVKQACQGRINMMFANNYRNI